MNKINKKLFLSIITNHMSACICFLIVTALSGCKNHGDLDSNPLDSHLYGNSCIMEIKPHPIDCDEFSSEFNQECIQLEFRLSSRDTCEVIMDFRELSYHCSHFSPVKMIEDDELSFDSLIQVLEFSQFLLENKSGNLRFFSDFPREDGTEVIYLGECLVDYEPWVLEKGKVIDVRSAPIMKEDLLVKRGDRQVRVHYFFILDGRELEPFILTSNWFSP